MEFVWCYERRVTSLTSDSGTALLTNVHGHKESKPKGWLTLNLKILHKSFSILSLGVLTGTAFAQQFPGAIFTTEETGVSVSQNANYGDPGDVYLSGGPDNQNTSGLPDGTYYFQVTDANGEKLLSTDDAVCRQLLVVNGRVAGATGPCPHSNGALDPANMSRPVQLAPFATMDDSGDEYKVWLIRKSSSTSISSSRSRVVEFSRANSKTRNFKLSSSAVPAGSCQPSNSMSVMVARKDVFSFVPKGAWRLPGQIPQKDIDFVKVEPDPMPVKKIPTDQEVVSCASDSSTGQTVCTTHDKDVYVFDGTSPQGPPLKSGASPGDIVFFGGSCMNCGVTIDAVHDEALLGLSCRDCGDNVTPAPVSGFQYVDLDRKPNLGPRFPSHAPLNFKGQEGEISKGILIDPIRNWILSANEGGNYEIIKVGSQKENRKGHKDNDWKDRRDSKKDDDDEDNKRNGKDGNKDRDKDRDKEDNRGDRSRRAYFEHSVCETLTDPQRTDCRQDTEPVSFASAGEDCSTGIALATVEDSHPSEIYLADLTRAQFTPGSPGTWNAPSRFERLLGSDFPATGPNGIAVAQGTHIGIVIGMNPSFSVTAIKLPAASGDGTAPRIRDWVTCAIPDSTGNGPHTVNAYQSPNTGHAMAVVRDWKATALWRIDLTKMLMLPRTAPHTCDQAAFQSQSVLRTAVLP